MNFKTLAVRIMAVVVMVGMILTGAATSRAAEREEDYTKKDVKQMATIIFCEAGNQTYAGKLAVGVVVMNRKRSPLYPNSVEKVITQRGQFSPVASGKWKAELKRYKEGKYESGVRAQCVKAAKEALEGATEVTYKGEDINMKKYCFFSQHLSGAKLRIGGHDFK